MTAPTRTGRPSAAASVLMVLCLPLLAYAVETFGGVPIETQARAVAWAAGFLLGALCLLSLLIQILRR